VKTGLNEGWTGLSEAGLNEGWTGLSVAWVLTEQVWAMPGVGLSEGWTERGLDWTECGMGVD
jgi:hypothetical protein